MLTSGVGTNPWFQEHGPRSVKPNEIVAFDTDLIGAYGSYLDFSRTWWIGDKPPRSDMIDAMQLAREHIDRNMSLLRPGIAIRDLLMNGHQLPDNCQKQKYGLMMHGVGLCDEWPIVAYPFDDCLSWQGT